MNIRKKTWSLATTSAIIFLSVSALEGQTIDSYKYKGSFDPGANATGSSFQFNGYTNYWHDTRSDWKLYGNLFKISVPDAVYSVAQSKLDIADDMHIPGLTLEEGFIFNILKSSTTLLTDPSLAELSKASASSDVLVLTDPWTETGKVLLSKLPGDKAFREKMKSHQTAAADWAPVSVFFLEKGNRKIYVIASSKHELRGKTAELIQRTRDLLGKYDLHRGWFGAETLLKSVTCTAGHPLEVIGKGMNEGNTWFTFSGYMDIFAQEELSEWLSLVDNPVVADVGTYMNYIPTQYTQAIFGCKNYDGLLLQSMYELGFMINWAHDKGGYAFRSVYDPAADLFHYDGYIANEGNKEQIDSEDVPFVMPTGSLDEDAVPSMVLFIEKGKKLTRELMWEAIMARREVAVLDNGKMMGPGAFRSPLQLLLLDRIWLEEYFGSRIILEATTSGYDLQVNITNTLQHPVAGKLDLLPSPDLNISGPRSADLNLPAGASKTLHFALDPALGSMGKTNPVLVKFKWENGSRSTMAMLDLPPVISAHQLLYGHEPSVLFPVTVHNYTDKTSFPVKIDVLDKDNPDKVVFTTTRTAESPRASFGTTVFSLSLPAGSYNVKISALGAVATGQLGVGKAEGKPSLTVVDLDKDGVDEYIMENDSVKVTLLATGGRVIEYLIKSRNDNALYKIWPVKPVDDKREFRKRGYYPYGGFEDFLGQASMETHKLYTAEVLKDKGDYVQVRLTADYFGNKLEKTYTLYGSSPLVECRFALTFINPEANMIAPVPVLDLGLKHWTEDVFIVPTSEGLKENRMQPERYYGGLFFPNEGWDAGYDTKEDISFVSAFPVKQPLYLHMFMNHPRNPDAHFYCHEFQPWVPIIQKTTTYFTFYMWGEGGNWKDAVKELRSRNLITEK